MPADSTLGRTAVEAASDSRRATVAPGASVAASASDASVCAALLLAIGFLRSPAGASARVTRDASGAEGAGTSTVDAAGLSGSVATGSFDRPPIDGSAAGPLATTRADPVDGSSPVSDDEALLARTVGRSVSRPVGVVRARGASSATSRAIRAPGSAVRSVGVSPRGGAASSSGAADDETFGATVRAGPAGRSLRSGRADRATIAGTAAAAGSGWVAPSSTFSPAGAAAVACRGCSSARTGGRCAGAADRDSAGVDTARRASVVLALGRVTDRDRDATAGVPSFAGCASLASSTPPSTTGSGAPPGTSGWTPGTTSTSPPASPPPCGGLDSGVPAGVDRTDGPSSSRGRGTSDRATFRVTGGGAGLRALIGSKFGRSSPRNSHLAASSLMPPGRGTATGG